MIQSRIVRRLRRQLTPNRPVSTPLYARAYVTIHWIFWASVILFSNISIVSELAFTGIILGVIGAAILCRESILREEEIAIEFANMHEGSREYDFSDWITLLINFLASLLVFLDYLKLMQANQQKTHATIPTLSSVLVLIISFTPIIITYIIMKLSNVWRVRRLKILSAYENFDARKDYIKRRYRLMGLCFVILGGWAQIPLILASAPAL